MVCVSLAMWRGRRQRAKERAQLLLCSVKRDELELDESEWSITHRIKKSSIFGNRNPQQGFKNFEILEIFLNLQWRLFSRLLFVEFESFLVAHYTKTFFKLCLSLHLRLVYKSPLKEPFSYQPWDYLNWMMKSWHDLLAGGLILNEKRADATEKRRFLE